jgi:ArsR family transcriptional regulator, virulence genes transcriptional regulator
MKRELYRMHAEMCKTFSNSVRLEILNLLRNGEWSVSDLVKKTGFSQANISQHLSIMKNKDVVLSKRKGQRIYYKLANRRIIRAFDIIREVLKDRLKKNKNLERSLRGK